MRRLLTVLALVALPGCPTGPNGAGDGGEKDGGATDGGPSDAGQEDAGQPDGGPADAGRVDPEPWHARARQAFEAVLVDYWNGGQNYFEREHPKTGALTGFWIFAQAYDLVLDNVAASNGRYAGWIDTMLLAQNARGWNPGYFDDLNWMALALIRAFDLTGQQQYLDRAQLIFNDIKTNAADTTCCGTPKGGLWWDSAHTQKATAVNAGAVLTAVRLASRTNTPALVTWAEATYAFWRSRMVESGTFRVWDHLETNGTVVTWRFTYNEGLMLGAALELEAATGAAKYRTDAEGFANALVTAQTKPGPRGDVLSDGTSAACTGDCPMFKGIAVRYLAAFHRAHPTPAVASLVASCAESVWNVARSGSEVHFGIDWAAAPTTINLNSDLAAAMALSAYASMLGPSTVQPSATRLEAEEALLVGLGLEDTHPGFTGFGYLAGWNQPNQTAQFTVTVATGGSHVLDLRYAAGAGAANRRVSVGISAGTLLPLPATTSWDVWSTVSTTVTLPVGASKVNVACDTTGGPCGYLNLDAFVVH